MTNTIKVEKTEQEKNLEQILRASIRYHMAGFENEVMDGWITEEEFKEHANEEEFMNVIEWKMKDAKTRGILTSENTSRQIEIKHINFLGKERIALIKNDAVKWAMTKY